MAQPITAFGVVPASQPDAASLIVPEPVRCLRVNEGRRMDDGGEGRPTGAQREIESSLDLLKRYRNGDGQALERLVQRHLPPLRRWATGRLPSWARGVIDTDDLIQDSLIQTVNKLDTFQPHHDGALQGYLRQTLHNRIREELRRIRRRPRREAIDGREIDPDPSPFEKAVGREALERYDEALQHLKEDDRAAIVMRIEHGSSYEEMARALERPSANAARMAVTRALVRLAERIADEP